jgi:hypothetical protein
MTDIHIASDRNCVITEPQWCHILDKQQNLIACGIIAADSWLTFLSVYLMSQIISEINLILVVMQLNLLVQKQFPELQLKINYFFAIIDSK